MSYTDPSRREAERENVPEWCEEETLWQGRKHPVRCVLPLAHDGNHVAVRGEIDWPNNYEKEAQ